MAYGFNNYHVNLVDGLKGHVTPEWFALLLTLEIILEILAAMYIADVVSGVVHLHLDYSISDDEELKQYSFKTKDECMEFINNHPVYKKATPYNQFLWKFHAHHDVTYPAFDTLWDQAMQSIKPGAIPYIASIVLYALGIMPAWVARIWILGVTLAFFSQYTHFAAHARNRGLITNPYYGPIVRKLQDWHIIVNPATHRVHHQHYDRDFCVFNGWANPLLNKILALGICVGYFPKHAPTVTIRAKLGHPRQPGVADGTVAAVHEQPGGKGNADGEEGAAVWTMLEKGKTPAASAPAMEPAAPDPYPIGPATVDVTVESAAPRSISPEVIDVTIVS